MHWAKNMRMMARFRFRSSVLILDRDSRLFICIFVSFPVYTAIPCTYVHTYISWKPQIHVDGKFLQLGLNYCTQHLVAYIQTNIHKYRKVTLHTINRCWRKLRRKLSYAYTVIPYSKYIHTYITWLPYPQSVLENVELRRIKLSAHREMGSLTLSNFKVPTNVWIFLFGSWTSKDPLNRLGSGFLTYHDTYSSNTSY